MDALNFIPLTLARQPFRDKRDKCNKCEKLLGNLLGRVKPYSLKLINNILRTTRPFFLKTNFYVAYGNVRGVKF